MRFPRRVGAVVSTLGVLTAGCSGSTAPGTAALPTVTPGSWVQSGDSVGLSPLVIANLESRGDAFVSKILPGNVAYRRSRFYVADLMRGAGINVYDSTGGFLYRIAGSELRSREIFGLWVDDRGIWIRDFRRPSILTIDTLGVAVERVSTSRTPGASVVTPGGLAVLDGPDGRVIFSSIFENNGLEGVGRSHLVGRYDSLGTMQARFARRSPIYEQLLLSSYIFSYFSIEGDRLYLAESALPRVRVYTTRGDSVASFGFVGGHYRGIAEGLPLETSTAWLDSLFTKFSYVNGVHVIRNVTGHNEPVVALSYQNYGEEWLSTMPRISTNTDNYVTLFSLEGDVLVAGLDLPGVLLGVAPDGLLLINLDDTPDRRQIGLYRLERHRAEIARR